MGKAQRDDTRELATAAGERVEIALQQTQRLEELLAANTTLTEEVQNLTRQIHERVVRTAGS